MELPPLEGKSELVLGVETPNPPNGQSEVCATLRNTVWAEEVWPQRRAVADPGKQNAFLMAPGAASGKYLI